MISYISRKPMTVTQVMEALPTWRPWKNYKSKGLTNGTSYAHGGEFTASDGKVHVWFDFFNLSGTNSHGAEEFEDKLDFVSDCSSGPDLDLFYVLAGKVGIED